MSRTVLLRGELAKYREEKVLSGTAYPGYLLEPTSAGLVKSHATRGGRHARWFVLEDALKGDTIDTAFADGDRVQVHEGEPGNRINAMLKVGENVADGDSLISYGDGTLAKAASSYLANNVAASTAAGTSSAAEATFSNGTVTVPANSLKVGDAVRVRGSVLFTATHSTDTATVKVKVGSTAVLTSPALDVADNDVCVFDATLVVRTIGASGTAVGFGFIDIGTPGTATTRAGVLASTAIDTTAAVTLTVTVTFSVSDAGNAAVLQTLMVENVKAGTTAGAGVGGGAIVGIVVEGAVDLSAASANARVKAELV